MLRSKQQLVGNTVNSREAHETHLLRAHAGRHRPRGGADEREGHGEQKKLTKLDWKGARSFQTRSSNKDVSGAFCGKRYGWVYDVVVVGEIYLLCLVCVVFWRIWTIVNI